jgi:hypothetical protein
VNPEFLSSGYYPHLSDRIFPGVNSLAGVDFPQKTEFSVAGQANKIK